MEGRLLAHKKNMPIRIEFNAEDLSKHRNDNNEPSQNLENPILDYNLFEKEVCSIVDKLQNEGDGQSSFEIDKNKNNFEDRAGKYASIRSNALSSYHHYYAVSDQANLMINQKEDEVLAEQDPFFEKLKLSYVKIRKGLESICKYENYYRSIFKALDKKGILKQFRSNEQETEFLKAFYADWEKQMDFHLIKERKNLQKITFGEELTPQENDIYEINKSQRS